VPARMTDDAVPSCGSDDLAVVVTWEREGTGLRGQVIAENVGDRSCRLASKPEVTPLRSDGSPLGARTITTREWRSPGYVTLQPRQRAAAPVAWASWCGQQASDRAQVDWPGGSAVAEVRGPAQPECTPGQPGNLISSWFDVIE
jgi:hypothetical protein